MQRMKAATVVKESEVLADSDFFKPLPAMSTSIYAFNIALSGDANGGFTEGLIQLAGPSKNFKTLYALILCKAFLDKNPDGIIIFYDSEFGSPASYFKAVGIDPTRVLHVPVANIEEMKFDIAQKFDKDGIKRGDQVMILVDSIGNIASKKEVEDAIEGKGAADLTRAKALKSFFRIVTPHLTLKQVPMVVINHVYASMDKYAPDTIGGGQGSIYSSNIILRVSKQQSKDKVNGKDEVVGYFFTITVEKSRFVKEKAKIPIEVRFGESINRFTGLFDIALELGTIKQGKSGWYSLMVVDKTTGEVKLSDKSRQKRQCQDAAFWKEVFETTNFLEDVKAEYKLAEVADLVSGEVAAADDNEEHEA